MDKKEHCSMAFGPLEYGARQHEDVSENGIEMVDYMLSNPPPPPPPPQTQTSFDKLSLTDVMQFADFGPKLALNHSSKGAASDDESYFLKFHLGDKLQEEPLAAAPSPPLPRPPTSCVEDNKNKGSGVASAAENPSSVQLLHSSGGGADKAGLGAVITETKPRRKRPRSMKTSEEVESQRMTHIAVERNRRRQMNEHLRVLRSLMPGSYVQRGDQASIIGGAIEFVRELEQLLQCLESQKRRRLFGNGEGPRPLMEGPPLPGLPPPQQQQQQTPFYHPLDGPDGDRSIQLMQELDPSGGGGGLREEMAENKSSLADIEVRLLGSDAMIKILSRRRPGQLIKIIAALEDVQFNILHTNITTIEQTVLYSFTVKIAAETRCTAEDIANSVLQILSYIDADTI